MNLTEHLLTCLAEEAAEITQQVSKSVRFGLEDRNVLDPTGPTNRERLIDELNDFMAVIRRLEWDGILPEGWLNPEKVNLKRHKIQKFLKYAKSVGALKP